MNIPNSSSVSGSSSTICASPSASVSTPETPRKESLDSPQTVKSMEAQESTEAQESMEVQESMDAQESRVEVKKEPEELLRTCTRRNSDSNMEESSMSSKNPYPISALIDVPTSLTRSSRTSSLSSSLSSFRFGGSLSTLWASQVSLGGKMSNLKSTG